MIGLCPASAPPMSHFSRLFHRGRALALLITAIGGLAWTEAEANRPAFRILADAGHGIDPSRSSPSLQLTSPQGSSPSLSEEQTRAEIRSWIATHQHLFALPASNQGPSPVPNLESATAGLFQQIIDFAAGVHKKSDSYYLFTVRTQFLREVSQRWPGFALVMMIQDTNFQALQGSGARIGGALGVQFPIIGQRSLTLDNHQGSAVMRFMPIAGYHERISLGLNPETRIHSPNTGIAIRPSAEIEATYRFDPLRGGVRFLAQPRLTSPHDVRMVAEVYLEYGIEVNSPVLKSIHIVPRCIADFSTNTSFFSDGLAPFTPLTDAANHQYSCGISAEFLETTW